MLLAGFLFLLSCKKEQAQDQKWKNEKIEVVNFQELEAIILRQDDKVRIVNFWATWCKPCIEELPFFEELNDAMGGEDLEVLLISLDFPDKLEDQLMPYVSKKRLNAEVLLLDDPHENEWIPKIDPSWSGAIPATLMIQGSRRMFFERSFTRRSLFDEAAKFIKD
jgi:thiol-disulfide isomerase/thioredoxin